MLIMQRSSALAAWCW